MLSPVHTHPVGRIEDHDDLAHEPVERCDGERVEWTRDMQVDGCILCSAGICTQRVSTGPQYARPHVVHGVLPPFAREDAQRYAQDTNPLPS